MSEPSNTTTKDGPVVDPAEVALHDYHFARGDQDRDSFDSIFVGALAHYTSKTPEGRKAWADALKAVQS